MASNFAEPSKTHPASSVSASLRQDKVEDGLLFGSSCAGRWLVVHKILQNHINAGVATVGKKVNSPLEKFVKLSQQL